MIESLFLPGKGSSESNEKGKKGKSQIISRLIQVKSTHMHDFHTRIQRQTDNIQHKISVKQSPSCLQDTDSSECLILFVM